MSCLWRLQNLNLRIFAVALLCLFSATRVQAEAFKSESTWVRVRVLKQQDLLSVSALSLNITESPTPYQRVAAQKQTKLDIRRIKMGATSVWKITNLSEATAVTKILRSPYLHLIGKEMSLQGQPMPSHILLAASDLKMDVVGFVPLEEYVASVVGSEVSPKWPLETLKAQAVATRSYTLAVMQERSRRLFHVESDVSDQVYKHLFHSDQISRQDLAKVSQAVVETQANSLVDPKSENVIKAFYHADCGGKTLSASQVGLGAKNYGVAEDPWCASNSKNKWKLEMTDEQIQKRLKSLLTIEASSLSGLKAFLDPDGKSVSKVEVQTDKGNQIFSSYELRRSLGWKEMRSTKFALEKIEQKHQAGRFVFQGQGYGHGVGLCQNGSRYLGQKGQNYEQILAHYYPLARLKKVR